MISEINFAASRVPVLLTRYKSLVALKTGRVTMSGLSGKGKPPTKLKPTSVQDGGFDSPLGWSPRLRQTVKRLFAVRWNLIVLRTAFPAICVPAGEAEAGSAGVQPAEE